MRLTLYERYYVISSKTCYAGECTWKGEVREVGRSHTLLFYVNHPNSFRVSKYYFQSVAFHRTVINLVQQKVMVSGYDKKHIDNFIF
jgi:hypothetical protein